MPRRSVRGFRTGELVGLDGSRRWELLPATMFRAIRVVVPDRSEQRSSTLSPAGINQVGNRFVEIAINQLFSVRNCLCEAFTVLNRSVSGAA